MGKTGWIFILAALCIMLSGCSSYKDIRVESCRLESLSPSGLKSVEAGFSVSVHNPVKEIVLTDIQGTVYYDGEELGFFEAPDVVVPGKSDSEVAVDVTATLGSRMSLMQLMAAASGFRAENFTLDLTCRVKVRGGIRKTVRLENVPVAELFRKVSYESI